MDKSLKNFLYFSFLLFCILSAAAAFLMLFNKFSTPELFDLLLSVLAGFIILLAAFCLFSVMVVYITYKNGRVNSLLYYPVKFALKALLPLVLMLSGVSKAARDSLRRLYIDVNNMMVESKEIKYQPSKILLLLPHCLQNSECNVKITKGIGRCNKCGRCCIGGIAGLSEEFGVETRVVTGGTAARNEIVKLKPEFVLSVACERDLSLGISDVGRIPVYGLVNERPEGPCHNTRVDVGRIREELEKRTLHLSNGNQRQDISVYIST